MLRASYLTMSGPQVSPDCGKLDYTEKTQTDTGKDEQTQESPGSWGDLKTKGVAVKRQC